MSEPCHDKPVNGVAQRAGGWRTGTPLFRSARNRNFLSLKSVGRAEIVSILKCILRLDHTYHNARSILKVSAIILYLQITLSFFVLFCFCLFCFCLFNSSLRSIDSCSVLVQ